MKQIFLLILTILILSCDDQQDQSFSSDFLLEHTGWLSIHLNEGMAIPSWDSENTFWTAYDHENRILKKMDMEGNVLDEIVLYVYPDPPSLISDPYVSSDGSTLVFTGDSGNYQSRDVFRIKPGSMDHELFTLDGTENVRLPNLSDLFITSPVYPWPDKLGYLGTQLDYNTMKGTQNYYIYDYTTGNTQSFFLGIYDFDYEGNVIGGDYYYKPDIYADPVYPGSMDMIMFCVRMQDNSNSDPVYTIRMFQSDGTVNFDGSADFRFSDIGGIRWLDEYSLLMTVQEGDTWKIISAHEGGETKEFYRTEKGLYMLDGLSLTPSKSRCLTRLRYNEFDSRSEIIIVNLSQNY